MTPEQFHDKWVDPHFMLSPNDKARKLCLEDMEEMLGSGAEVTFEALFDKVSHLFADGASAYYKSAMEQMDDLVKQAKDNEIPF